MDIKIVTLHAIQNPGSAWQAYALQAYLAPKHGVEIIDYRPSYFQSEGRPLKHFAKLLLHGYAYRSRKRKFDRFVRERMNLGQRFESAPQLEAAGLKADVFMTGSDQLWNLDFPCGRDPVFYLSFAGNALKINILKEEPL